MEPCSFCKELTDRRYKTSCYDNGGSYPLCEECVKVVVDALNKHKRVATVEEFRIKRGVSDGK